MPTRGSFPGFLPLVKAETYPPGALFRGFCPWSRLKHAHQGQFSGVFAPGASAYITSNFVKSYV